MPQRARCGWRLTRLDTAVETCMPPQSRIRFGALSVAILSAKRRSISSQTGVAVDGSPAKSKSMPGAGLECVDTLGLAMRPCGMEGLHGLEQPHGRVPSVLCLRNDSSQRRSPRQSHSRGPAEASARAARLGPAQTQRITHRGGTGAANRRCRVTRPAAPTQRTYDTARGSDHDDRPPLARLPLDL